MNQEGYQFEKPIVQPEEITELPKVAESDNIQTEEVSQSVDSTKDRLNELRAELGIPVLDKNLEKSKDAKVFEGNIKDFSDAFKPLFGRLALRREKGLNEIMKDNEVWRTSSGLAKLSDIDFAKPESFQEAEMLLKGITGSIDSIGKIPPAGPLRDDWDNLESLAHILRDVSEQANKLRYRFQSSDNLEARRLAPLFHKLKDITSDRGKYLWRRADLLKG